MIADILVYTISKSGTLLNFGTFLIVVFSRKVRFQKIMKKFLTTISAIKYTMRHILKYFHDFSSLYMYSQ